jgi:biopolymer transport protein ExbD
MKKVYKNNVSHLFCGGNGTEGMLDVILACTLIFLLISCLVRVGSADAQEKTLPAVNLSKSTNNNTGASRIKKNVITLKNTGKIPIIYFDDNEISLENLKSKLSNMDGISQIALRRDADLPCSWEDKVIMMCRDAGVYRVSIVVKQSNTGVPPSAVNN